MNHIPEYVRPGGKSYVSDEGIIYCTDGKLRWVYEIDQRKHPTVWLTLLWKYVALALAVGVFFVYLTPGMTALTAITAQLILLGTAAAASLAVFGVRLLENGRFVCLVYTLDEQSVSCQQVKGKTDKGKVTHAFAVWVGGQSQPAVRVCSLGEARLDRVHTIVAKPNRSCLLLRGAKGLKRVFVEPQQLHTVADCLKQHCKHRE